jgi:ribosome-associated protein
MYGGHHSAGSAVGWQNGRATLGRLVRGMDGAVGVQMAGEAIVEKERERTELRATSTLTSLEAATLAAHAGLDKKAEDVRVLDVRELATYTDFLVLMTAGSDRQVSAVADSVDEALRKHGYRPIGVEGMGAGNWILIDAGDVVVHIFHTEARSFYDLDGLWSDAKRVPISEATRPNVTPVA